MQYHCQEIGLRIFYKTDTDQKPQKVPETDKVRLYSYNQVFCINFYTFILNEHFSYFILLKNVVRRAKARRKGRQEIDKICINNRHI